MIKTLIFDFGQIFIDLQPEVAFQKLKHLGIGDFTAEMLENNLKYETGQITSQEFLQFYQKQFPEEKLQTIVETWNAVLGDFPLHRLHFLEDLAAQKRFRLILLSNTNELHLQCIAERFSFFEDFIACFDRIYFSHEIGMRKPDSAIYQLVMEENKLNPQECFFIDDLKENTEAAEKAGISSWNLDPSCEDISQLFTKHSFLPSIY